MAIIILVVGSLVAGYETLDSQLFGYFVVILNNATTAMQGVFQKGFSDKTVCEAASLRRRA